MFLRYKEETATTMCTKSLKLEVTKKVDNLPVYHAYALVVTWNKRKATRQMHSFRKQHSRRSNMTSWKKFSAISMTKGHKMLLFAYRISLAMLGPEVKR